MVGDEHLFSWGDCVQSYSHSTAGKLRANDQNRQEALASCGTRTAMTRLAPVPSPTIRQIHGFFYNLRYILEQFAVLIVVIVTAITTAL